MNQNIDASLFSTCSDCKRYIQDSKTWCNSCYRKRCLKWDREIIDFKKRYVK